MQHLSLIEAFNHEGQYSSEKQVQSSMTFKLCVRKILEHVQHGGEITQTALKNIITNAEWNLLFSLEKGILWKAEIIVRDPEGATILKYQEETDLFSLVDFWMITDWYKQ